MDEPADSLSEDIVRKVDRIIATLDRSTFDYLQLESGELKLTLAKGRRQAPLVRGPHGRPHRQIGIGYRAMK